MKNEKQVTKKTDSKKLVKQASVKLVIPRSIMEKDSYSECWSRKEYKEGKLFLSMTRYDGEKELLTRSVVVTKEDCKTLQNACKIKDERKRRDTLLAVSWKYVTSDKLATDTESVNLGLFKKARNRDIVCAMLNELPNCSKDMY